MSFISAVLLMAIAVVAVFSILEPLSRTLYGPVAELADARDLKSLEGSTPVGAKP